VQADLAVSRQLVTAAHHGGVNVAITLTPLAGVA